MTAAPKLPDLPEPSAEQAEVIRTVEAWIAKATAKGRKRVPLRFTFGGHAGTGKTTIVAHLLRRHRAKVATFTGKAAHVLNNKGVPATTIHSLIYWCFQACTTCGKGEEKCECQGARFEMRYSKVPELDADIVIIDEASMVAEPLLEDLESYRVPVLYVGDHGQLEPVGEDPGLMKAPDIKLETIHRQAAGSPIIRFAHHVRQGGDPAEFASEDDMIVYRGMPSDLRPYDVILCGYNRMRVAVNAKVRRQLGYTGARPVKGERVICLRNNREHGLFNGMLAIVERCDGQTLDVVDAMGTKYKRLPIESRQFGAEQTLRDADKDATLWDFGYAITVHKSQGSEFDRVLVLEQIAERLWDAKRWRYTAATRASQHLTYCLPTGYR
jgi:ATP-dependent exoDNAse (exonuclease V) alpha subunit